MRPDPDYDAGETLWTWHRKGEGPFLWKTGSALQRAKLRVRVSGDDYGPKWRFIASVGGPGAWSSVGRIECAWELVTLDYHWRSSTMSVHATSMIGTMTSEGSRFELETFDDPHFAFCGSIDEETRLPFCTNLASYEKGGFRPYAVIGDEFAARVEAPAGVDPWSEQDVFIREVEAWVGAKPEPIVALGDSQIHGGLVTEALKELGAPGMVISGKAGGDSAGALARMETDVFPFNPRHLLLWVGSNDIGYAESDGRGAEAGMARALENIDAIIGEAQARGVRCHLLGALPRGMAVIPEFNRRLSLLAGSRRVDFHDAYDVLHRRNNKMDLRYSDGLHPNAEGARMLAAFYRDRGLVDALAE